MQTERHANALHARRKPLATCVAALFALAAPAAFASTWVVTNCADNGPGSLRDAVTNYAQSDDTVDLSQLTCSKISLTSGAIVISQYSLFLDGPAQHARITGAYGKYADRIIKHTGTGTLQLYRVDVDGGYLVSTSNGTADGGCIYSNGRVRISSSRVSGCVAHPAGTANGQGGGIFARGDVWVDHSQIVSSRADGPESYGGGVFSYGSLNLKYSTIDSNKASGAAGAFTLGGAYIYGSTISRNAAKTWNGALVVAGDPTKRSLMIVNSTISSNTAGNGTAGVRSNLPTGIFNSTIAFNVTSANNGYAAGLHILSHQSHGGSIAVNLQSTIISNNTVGSSSGELDFSDRLPAPGDAITLTNANNIIRTAAGPVQPGTTTACPRLGPLQSNGGPTFTHAPLSGSPVIDAGGNPLGRFYDQREFGHTRVAGAATDIGAFEVQPGEVLQSGSNNCP